MSTNLQVSNFTSYLQTISVSDSQELRWVAGITYAARGAQDPWADMNGEFKPVLEVTEFGKLKGNQIVFTIARPLGGEGQQGAGTMLIGNEESQYSSTFRATIGYLRHAVATEATIKAQTVIGGEFDRLAQPQLAEWLSRRMSNDKAMEIFVKKSARTTLFPNGKTSRDQLGRQDYLDLNTVERAKMRLSANQAMPFAINKDPKKGNIVKRYMVMGNFYAWDGAKASQTYLNLLATAGIRGDQNMLWSGKMPDWDNTVLYNYDCEDGTQVGPLGEPGTGRGYTAVAIAATDVVNGATFDLKLGGLFNASAIAGTAPFTTASPEYIAGGSVALFTKFFPGAQYIGHEGLKLAATTTIEYYIGIYNFTESTAGAGDVGKVGFYAYKVNNSNKLTLTKALRPANDNNGTSGRYITIGSMTWDAGDLPAAPSGSFAGLATAHAPGSLVLAVNAKGVPFIGSWALGKHALISGYGSVDNVNGDGEGSKHAKRIMNNQDYGDKWGIGIAQRWGVTANQDANNMPNGFVYIESAYMPPGWPQIN